MTTQVLVDFNTRDEQGHVPAYVGTLDHLPAIGEAIDAVDDEGNRCIARIVGIVGSIIALDPEWRTFVEPTDNSNRLVPNRAPRGWSISWSSSTSMLVERDATRDIQNVNRRTTSGRALAAGHPVR